MAVFKKVIIILILVLFSNFISAQNFKGQNEYVRKMRILGISFNEVNFFNKKSHSIIFNDSSYISFISVNKTIPRGYTKNVGMYYKKNEKIILLSNDRKYKILKIKSKYLLNNILFGIVREEYYLVKNE